MHKQFFLFSDDHMYHKYLAVCIQYSYNRVFFINNLNLLDDK